jgi:hypothetical protein
MFITLSGFDYNQVLREVYLFQTISSNNNPPVIEHISLGDGVETTTIISVEEKENADAKSMFFFDTKKNCVKYYGNMLDISAGGPLPITTSIPCWNCRRKFSSAPLGIPLRYHKIFRGKDGNGVEWRAYKMYLQEKNYPQPKDGEECGYFETEGVVCSWECMKNFLLENSHISKYNDAVTLMYLLHLRLTGKELKCKRGPSWRCMKEWGGHITNEEMARSVTSMSFQETVNCHRPLMFSISRYYEQL